MRFYDLSTKIETDACAGHGGAAGAENVAFYPVKSLKNMRQRLWIDAGQLLRTASDIQLAPIPIEIAEERPLMTRWRTLAQVTCLFANGR